MSSTSTISSSSLSRRIYSVSEFSDSLSKDIAEKFPSICVRGEISGLSKPSSGHWYFSLKDEGAQIRSVMFRSSNLKAHQIQEGEEIIACGRPGIYKNRGDLQLIVNHLQLAGAGDLQKQFEDLKNKLRDEGHFDLANKQPIPSRPEKVAIITSASGAVIHDIQTVTKRRASILPLLLIPASVQGSEAIASITKSILVADERDDIDLIVLARGGGSLEDFAAFNSAEVAMAIVACKTPLLCAVGHESDISIADMIADKRAATPSEAAEIITEGYVSWQKELQQMEGQIHRSLKTSITNLNVNLDKAFRQLKSPLERLEQAIQRLDFVESALLDKINSLFQKKQHSCDLATGNLSYNWLAQSISEKRYGINVLKQKMETSQKQRIFSAKQRFNLCVQKMEAMNPLSVLSRGYGIVENSDGKVISSIKQAKAGETIQTHFNDGKIKSTILDVKNA